MKKAIICILITAILLFCVGCTTSTGRNDMPLFIKKFNENAGKNMQINIDTLKIHADESETPITYYAFFPANEGNEYLLSFAEDVKGNIQNFSICIVSTIDVNPDTVYTIFSSAMYAFKEEDNKSNDKLFKELKLDSKETYRKTANIKKETDTFTLEVMVNDAGCGIYVY